MQKIKQKIGFFYHKSNSYYHGLLISLLAIFIISPFFDYAVLATQLLRLALLTTLFFSIMIMNRNKRLVIFAIILGAPIIVIETFQVLLVDASELSSFIKTLFAIGFISLIIAVMLHDMFTSTKVDGSLIVGAVSLYLLLGLLWGFIYLGIDYVFPYSFNFTIHGDIKIEDRIGYLMYYSMVTLTTLGYGDVIPLSPPARGMAAIQAAMGQLYLTVLVARLVGMHILYKSETKK